MLRCLFVLIVLAQPVLGQSGPKGARCTAYASGKTVAKYNCLASRDSSGNINFIQWEHGTASTGLGGAWKRAGKDCFASSESPTWKICLD